MYKILVIYLANAQVITFFSTYAKITGKRYMLCSLLFTSILPPRGVGSRPNPVREKCKEQLFPPWGHLSDLIQRIGSYFETKAKPKTLI